MTSTGACLNITVLFTLKHLYFSNDTILIFETIIIMIHRHPLGLLANRRAPVAVSRLRRQRRLLVRLAVGVGLQCAPSRASFLSSAYSSGLNVKPRYSMPPSNDKSLHLPVSSIPIHRLLVSSRPVRALCRHRPDRLIAFIRNRSSADRLPPSAFSRAIFSLDTICILLQHISSLPRRRNTHTHTLTSKKLIGVGEK